MVCLALKTTGTFGISPLFISRFNFCFKMSFQMKSCPLFKIEFLEVPFHFIEVNVATALDRNWTLLAK